MIIVHAYTMIIVHEFMSDDQGAKPPGMQGGLGGRRPPNVHRITAESTK